MSAKSLKVFALMALLAGVVHARSATTIEAYNQGVQRFNAGQYSQAIEYFDKAIDHDAEFTDALFARAICKRNQKNLEGALSDLNQTVRVKPDFIDAYAVRGAVLYEGEQWDSAYEDFGYVLERRPKDAQALLGHGLVALKKNDLKVAQRDFRRFLEVKPNDPLAPRLRKLLASLSQDAREAEDDEASAPSAPHRDQHASEASQRIAQDLFMKSHETSENYTRKVIRGERAQAVGEIEPH